jgi:hypothetical protein
MSGARAFGPVSRGEGTAGGLPFATLIGARRRVPETITNPPEVTAIVLQRLIDSASWDQSGKKCRNAGRNHRMGKEDQVDIEKMSLPELAALEADVIHRVAADPIAPREPNTVSDEAEKRKMALKREISAH